jgi:intein/homing endonuclease
MRQDVNLKLLSKEEIGYLAGFFVGDGNIFVSKKLGVYRVRLFTYYKEANIQQKLKNILDKILRVRSYLEERDHTFIFEWHSKDFIKKLLKIADKNGLKKKISKESERAFIEGLIDSDGYVQRNYCEITTANPKLKNCIKKILKRFGVKCITRNFLRPNGKMGFRAGFSLNGYNFFPCKWVTGVRTAE